ncbi:MAG: glycosyltransferase family 39 protein [Xenococcaceae cyanobacterium MO_188.B29]|nr:glycosyltransferase family 39 protein [Xenococcaceae cyanobacterium MO_188.B29]
MNLLHRLRRIKLDGFLITALLGGFFFCLYGINWGRLESWHPDQMAFRGLFREGEIPLNPGYFLKPPFYTYYIFFLARLPLKVFEKIFHISSDTIDPLLLSWSRVLTVFLFLGSLILVFQITKRFFGLFPARIITLVFATSANFIVHSHYLTTDIPVIFVMLVAFYFTQNILLKGRLSDYALAGFFTGIATATKYNGLAIGIAIVVAHVLALSSISWKKLLFSKKLFLGLSMVVIGFVAGNPFALLDYSTFISDFLYNYTITPVYSGEKGHSYWQFFLTLPTIIGWPSLLISSIAIVFSLYLVFSEKQNWMEKKAMLLMLSVLLVYYYKFASFPRVEPRFVMPIVPLWLIISGPFWNKIKLNRIVVSILLVILISYNTVCSFYVAKRFAEDPRMIALEWVKENIPQGSSIEYTYYSPNWNKVPEMNFRGEIMPFIGGRKRVFKQQFQDNNWLVGKLETAEEEADDRWYSLESLKERNPEYISINSMYYSRFITGNARELYPSVKQFFSNLINENYPYQIVFDRQPKAPPIWIYPQKINPIDTRTVIFARKDL